MPRRGEEKFDDQFSFKLPREDAAALREQARLMGSTDQIVLRELVRAFNAFCEHGRRPVFPFEVCSLGYAVRDGRIVDARDIRPQDPAAPFTEFSRELQEGDKRSSEREAAAQPKKKASPDARK